MEERRTMAFVLILSLVVGMHVGRTVEYDYHEFYNNCIMNCISYSHGLASDDDVCGGICHANCKIEIP